MASFVSDLENWFDQGIEKGATHLIVVVDTFNFEDYPVYVMPDQNVKEVEKVYMVSPMQRVSKVFDLSKSKNLQIHGNRF